MSNSLVPVFGRKPAIPRKLKIVFSAFLLALSVPTYADSTFPFALDGFPGVIHTPTANLPKDGTVSFGLSRYVPYAGLNLRLQPLSWFGFGIRYTSIDDREYGPGIKQSYKDKGFDIVIRLLKEGAYIPSFAIGMIDIGGTGVFGSEYLVATKHIANGLELSAGLAWGRMGSSGGFKNPLISVSEHFAERPVFDGEQGGDFTADQWFSGERIGLFSSLNYAPSGTRFSFQLEYEANDYDNRGFDAANADAEPAEGLIESASRWNFGVSYRIWRGAEFGLRYVRGNQLAGQLGFSAHWGKDERNPRKYDYPAWISDVPAVFQQNVVTHGEDSTIAELAHAAWQNQTQARAVDIEGDKARFWYSSQFSDLPSENAINASRVVFNATAGKIRSVETIEMMGGVPATVFDVPIAVAEQHAHGGLDDSEWLKQVERKRGPSVPRSRAKVSQFNRFPTWKYEINTGLRSNLGGPSGFYLADFQLKPGATIQFSDSVSLTGALAWTLFGNLDEIEPKDSSALPHVRSDLEKYQTEGSDVYLQELDLQAIQYLGKELYGRFSIGVFEEMYAGAGAELMWRPAYRSWAASININHVYQRDYQQWFGFLDYQATTGHLNFRWETPLKGIVVQTHIGRYLAGDVGGTLRLMRKYRNGVEIGAYATKTNVSAEEFGEGGFDKGVFFYVPLGAVSQRGAGHGRMSFNYSFLTRDGGQFVNDGRKLISLLGVGVPSDEH